MAIGLFARRAFPRAPQGLDEVLDSSSLSIGLAIDERARAGSPPGRQGDRDQSGRSEARNGGARNDADAKAVGNRVFQTVKAGHDEKQPPERRGISGPHRDRLREWYTSQRDEPFGVENRHRQLGPRRKRVALRQQDAEARSPDG